MRSRRTLKAISAHSRALRRGRHTEPRARLHSEVCAGRLTEVKDQEMRGFVVRHSVFRIHAVLAAAIAMLVAAIFRRSPIYGSAENLASLFALAGLIVATSAYCIGAAIRPRRGSRHR